MSNKNRPLANFPPNIWGDIFLNPSKLNIDGATQLQHQELKEEVRRMIQRLRKNCTEFMSLTAKMTKLWRLLLFDFDCLERVDFLFPVKRLTVLDFNLLQNSHKEELCKLSRWWKDLDFSTKLPFARDREAEETMAKQGQSYSVQYSINKFKQLSESYFLEFKWYHENYIPTLEEYMRVATISIGVIGLVATSFIGMGDVLTPVIFNWASNNLKIIVTCSIHGRLFDDIVSHKFKQERGHSASAVECYMREHVASEEEACNELKKQDWRWIHSRWKNYKRWDQFSTSEN
ncbi:hypothetical protein V6N13_147593 [Hibiscus sabdariffa]